jgi:hypothetical protein
MAGLVATCFDWNLCAPRRGAGQEQARRQQRRPAVQRPGPSLLSRSRALATAPESPAP